MAQSDEINLEEHFAFGKNWQEFAVNVGAEHLSAAQDALVRLIGRTRLDGLSFLDVGCGSGIHAIAAAQLGAHVSAIDIDPVCTETAIALADRFGVSNNITVLSSSVFDLPGDQFDIVYSWGVLHHTGAMWNAVQKAASLVKPDPGSLLVLALYRRTRFCRLWRWEKRWYRRASPRSQALARNLYSKLLLTARAAQGSSPEGVRSSYPANRGMNFDIDVHDWLGGYPYESATPNEVRTFVTRLDFVEEYAVVRAEHTMPLQPFGSGCDEYRFARPAL